MKLLPWINVETVERISTVNSNACLWADGVRIEIAAESDEDQVAILRLILAAPQMLEALRAIQPCLIHASKGTGDRFARLDALARAAIAKIDGEDHE